MKIRLCLFFASLVTVPVASATEDENLAWLASELSMLAKQVKSFEAQQDTTSPVARFKYDALLRDMQLMINGIEAKLQRRDNPAYVFDPLTVEVEGY